MPTKTQKEIISMLNEGLTIKEIAHRRKKSVQAIYKTIKKLKLKGILTGNFWDGFKVLSTTPPYHQKMIRLHGQEFNIKLKIIPINSIRLNEFRGSRLRFFNNSIEVYSKKHFFGKTGWEAHYNSVLYFRRYFIDLQNELCILFSSIKEVNGHYAEMDNELARDNYTKKKKFGIKSIKDGKTWLKTDFSFNINELEFLHPKTALEDTDNLLSYLNDFRDNKPLNNSQLTMRLNDSITAIEKIKEVLELITKRIS